MAVKSLTDWESIEPYFIDPMSHRAAAEGNWFLETLNGSPAYFQYKDYSSCVDAYEKCPPVSAIINRKTQAFINGKTWLVNTMGKVATGEVAKRVNLLFDHPNPLQSRKQFEAQSYIYYQCFGFNIILAMTPVGMDRTYTQRMYNIPVNMVDIKETENLFYDSGKPTIEYVILKYKNNRIKLNIDNLFIQKDITASFETLLFPGSKLKAMEKPIRNVIGAYDSRNTLINNRGPMGIFTDDGRLGGTYVGLPMTPTEKKEMQRDLRGYGLRKGQYQAIIAAGALKWQSMGFDVGQLKLMEEVKDSAMAICDGLNFPPHLLGLIDPTFNNQNAAEKGLYQNSIIPDSDNINEQWNSWFQLSEYNLSLDKDYSHLPVLQEDREAAGRARQYANLAYETEYRYGLMTMDQWLAKNGEDPLPEGRGKLYFPEYVALYGDPKATNNGQANAASDAGTTGTAQAGQEGQNQSNQPSNT